MNEANKQKSLIDISVLLVFFTRPDTFAKVFDVVKQARPARLFLYQDGPREARPDDIENIAKCREIAADIDWDCEVKTLYQEKNVGCDPSGYIAHTWAFSQTDKCIVIEDDDVPSVSFFSFCKEVLDKYENDPRVMLVSGINFDEITEYCPYDYFFSTATITAGCWASWSRVVNKWDKDYSFLKDEYQMRLISGRIKESGFSKGFLPSCKNHSDSGKAHFETIMISNQYLNSGLTVIPKKNMVINIGLTGDATHTSLSLECLPRGYRRIFMLKTFDVSLPINHPPFVIEDVTYKNRAYRIEGWGHPFVKIWRLIESSFYRLLHGDVRGIFRDVKDKFGKFISGRAG